MAAVEIDGIIVSRPTRDEVQGLMVGDLALDCFGKMSRVVSIYAQCDDIHGKAFVLFYTEFGRKSSVSGSMKEGQVVPTLPVTEKWKRTELVPT